MMEACTLALYQKNIFRVTGLPVDATSKEVARQAQKLQMLEEMGGAAVGSQPAFALAVLSTTDEIRNALSRMKEPEHRIVDEFFWYWPEKFGASGDDPAIQAMLAGEKERAVHLWKEREKQGSYVAQHNMAVMYHMHAVDWTNYHVSADLDRQREGLVKAYWRESFERWEPLMESDEFWDMLKERVRSLNDEALTTGFIRRMQRQLPMALDRINAEAALLLAEQGRMDWAKFHVDFMRETHSGLDDVESTMELVLSPTRRRIEQHLESCSAQFQKSGQRSCEPIQRLIEQCRPLLGIYDLFHGKDSHQRSELFDHVAEQITSNLVEYQQKTGDDASCVVFLKLALDFASGSRVRERIIENISTCEGNVSGDLIKPFFVRLHEILEDEINPAQKLARITGEILSKMPQIAQSLGVTSDTYREFGDSLAIALRSISVDSHNQNRDYGTANLAIQQAFNLSSNADLKNRIRNDIKALQDSENSYVCAVCSQAKPDASCTLRMPIVSLPPEIMSKISNEDRRNGYVDIPRCRACRDRQSQPSKPSSSGCLLLLFIPSIAGISILSQLFRLFE